MKAEEFFEEEMPNIRELWHLSELQKEKVYILMEKYAALRIADVVGRSEQLVCPDCAEGRDPFEPNWECPDCRQKDEAN